MHANHFYKENTKVMSGYFLKETPVSFSFVYNVITMNLSNSL